MDAQSTSQDDSLYHPTQFAHVLPGLYLRFGLPDPGFGPPIADGFYYDFILVSLLTEDFPADRKEDEAHHQAVSRSKGRSLEQTKPPKLGTRSL